MTSNHSGGLVRRDKSILAFSILASVCNAPAASDLSGDVQITYAISRDQALQKSLVQTSLYVETELTPDVFGFFVGYHDREFRSGVLGLARAVGLAQVGLGVGQAHYDGRSHFMLNPWVSLSGDNYKAYVHAEHYASEADSPRWYKAYGLWKLGRVDAGVYYDSSIGLGPRVDLRVLEQVSLSLTAAVNRPRDGNFKALVGVTVEF